MSGDLTSWVFEDAFLVRMIEICGEPWWVASDVCGAIGVAHTATALRKLDADEKGVHPMHTPGGQQEMSIISEPGLYKLIFRSDKPVARRFDRWVRHEVLPSIRKTGRYTVDREEPVETAPDTGVLSDTNVAELRRAPIKTRLAYCESIRLGCGNTAYREALVVAGVPVPQSVSVDQRAAELSVAAGGADELAAVDRFVAACVAAKAGGRVPARAMYRAYEAWSLANGRRPTSEIRFARAMKPKLTKDSRGSIHAYLDCALHDVPERPGEVDDRLLDHEPPGRPQ